MPGAKYNSILNPRQYEKLKTLGFSKSSAAAISNASYDKGHGHHPHHKKKKS